MKPERIARVVFAALLCVACACANVAAQTASQVDVPKLIADAQRNGEAMSRRVFDYSWTSRTLARQFNRSGRKVKEVAQDHEVYPSPGLTYVVQKLVKENGLPLSPKRAAKEEQRVQAALVNADIAQAAFYESASSAAAADKSGCPYFGIWTVINSPGGKETSFGVSDFLCFGEFFSPRVERVGGRDTIALDFRPRAGFAPPSAEKKPFMKLVGTVWIDLKDRVVARVEAWPAENPQASAGQSLARGKAAVVFEDVRLPEGVWVRRLRHIDTTANPTAFNGLNVEWRQEFGEYRRYYTKFEDYKIEEPKEPSKTP